MVDPPASQFDAVFIAGDFLDIFIAEHRAEQAADVQLWLRRLARITKLQSARGNHETMRVSKSYGIERP